MMCSAIFLSESEWWNNLAIWGDCVHTYGIWKSENEYTHVMINLGLSSYAVDY